MAWKSLEITTSRPSLAPVSPPSSGEQVSESLPLEPEGVALGPEEHSEWGSLAADLSRDLGEPVFRVHDRTHLEVALEYPLGKDAHYEWEAYFFVPESLRLDSQTYAKSEIYSDLQSYVRFAVPRAPFSELKGVALDRIRDGIAKNQAEALDAAKLLVCQVRSAGVAEKRRISGELSAKRPVSNRVFRLTAMAKELTQLFREILTNLPLDQNELREGLHWVDEDLSRLTETLLGDLALELQRADGDPDAIKALTEVAVSEARYRRERGYDGVGRLNMSTGDAEHIEFRRHVLKRFTSQALWLHAEVRPAATWVLQLLYAIAAGMAMSFAVIAALWNGNDANTRGFFQWAVVVILAYAAKDRIKAMLQNAFQRVVNRVFPDRSWKIQTLDHTVELGRMDEQSGFLAFSEVPADVLGMRRLTRSSPFEESARPESVLFHRKEILLEGDSVKKLKTPFDAITEILRLDLHQWLAHTDDPKRRFVFADPELGTIHVANAPRVYNIAAVYRLRDMHQKAVAPWRRTRFVVSRKGVRRIEEVR